MPRLWPAWALVLVASGVSLALVGRAALAAKRRAAAAMGTLTTVSAQAQELAAMRSAAPRQAKAGTGLAERVSGTLARAGLPASALSALSPESGARRATLTLDGVTLPQVGAFLDAWRKAEPAWGVSSVDLSPLRGGAPGADLPLRCVLGLEAGDPAQSRLPGSLNGGGR